MIHIDGSSNREGCGAGLVITGPDDLCLSYALGFHFPTSNNEAPYEALVSALRIVQSLRIKQLTICSDSQLVVGQSMAITKLEILGRRIYLSLPKAQGKARAARGEANRPANLLSRVTLY